MQMVAGVVGGKEPVRFFRVPEGFVKVNASVDEVCGADEIVVSVAHFLAEGGISTPAAHREQSTYINFVAKAAGFGDVRFQTVDQLLHRGEVAHGPEHIDGFTHRVDDVVDALLDDDSVGTIGGNLVVEAIFAGQAVGFVG